MAQFGTIEVYQEMERALSKDDKWKEISNEITYTMIFQYRAPVGKSFFLRFVEGDISEVRELSEGEPPEADFCIAADPDTWRGLFDRSLKPMMAITRGKIKVQGNMGTLMKHMKAFTFILDAMSDVDIA